RKNRSHLGSLLEKFHGFVRLARIPVKYSEIPNGLSSKWSIHQCQKLFGSGCAVARSGVSCPQCEPKRIEVWPEVYCLFITFECSFEVPLLRQRFTLIEMRGDGVGCDCQRPVQLWDGFVGLLPADIKHTEIDEPFCEVRCA